MGSVTNAMALLLTKKMNKPPLLGDTFNFRVTTLPPDDERVSEETGINLFLYHVSEHPNLRSTPWRGDRDHPQGSKRPALTLRLNYLMTAYAKRVANGTQDDIAAHWLLGNAMAVFNEHSVLNDIHDADFDADVEMQFAAELRASFEKVKVTLMPTAIEELAKIWTGLTKAYRLSVAYEVSLVQIPPLAPAAPAAPGVQQPTVIAVASAPPAIEAITPQTVSTGAQLVISGSSFVQPGATTSVVIGGVELDEEDLISVEDDRIVLLVPSSIKRGPAVKIEVSRAGMTSAPASCRVEPWISSLSPMRGPAGIPITIPIRLPSGAAVAGEIDGQPVVALINADRTSVTLMADLPTNGPKSVALVISDPAPRRTNALSFEVLPSISSFALATVGAPPRTTITVQGERLAGSEVQLRLGRLLAQVGPVATATSITFQFDRLIATPPDFVSVIVDGRESNRLPRFLSEIRPMRASVGDSIVLAGSGLSGRNVSVHVEGDTVAIGPQPFDSRFEFQVPAGLTPGPRLVRVTVDGSDTNAMPFEVVS